MPRRTREQVIADVHRLHDCFEAAIEALQGTGTARAREFLAKGVATRARRLSWVEDGNAPPLQIAPAVRSALADMRMGPKDLTRNRPEQSALVHHRHAAIRSRSFTETTARPPRPETTP